MLIAHVDGRYPDYRAEHNQDAYPATFRFTSEAPFNVGNTDVEKEAQIEALKERARRLIEDHDPHRDLSILEENVSPHKFFTNDSREIVKKFDFEKRDIEDCEGPAELWYTCHRLYTSNTASMAADFLEYLSPALTQNAQNVLHGPTILLSLEKIAEKFGMSKIGGDAEARLHAWEHDAQYRKFVEEIVNEYATFWKSTLQATRDTLPSTEACVQLLLEEGSEGIETLLDHDTGAHNHVMAQANALSEEYQRIVDTQLSSKIKSTEILRYSLELSQKAPDDVKFGNDGGCCLGVYTRDQIMEGAGYLHELMLDNSALLFNVLQRRKSGAKRRTGVDLAFDALDTHCNRVLVVNSTELSTNMNPLMAMEQIVNIVEEGLIQFGLREKYLAVFMARTAYNTSHNYSSRSQGPVVKEKFAKMGTCPVNYYADILAEDCTLSCSEGFYALYDHRPEISD
jgi:hypothetical protein